jgi:tripartite-type tricarboxylate transporter receptor subunit TctC
MELGFNVEFYNWYGLHAVKGTPGETLRILRETIGQAMKDQQFVDAMEKIQTPITYMSAEAFQVFLDRNAKIIVETIRRIGKVG